MACKAHASVSCASRWASTPSLARKTSVESRKCSTEPSQSLKPLAPRSLIPSSFQISKNYWRNEREASPKKKSPSQITLTEASHLRTNLARKQRIRQIFQRSLSAHGSDGQES